MNTGVADMPNVYQLTNTGTAPRFNTAFATGCGGAPIITDGKLRPGPVALWGEHRFWPTLKIAIEEGRTWYYGDHSYFGRHKFFRVTRNALQSHGHFFDGGAIYESNMARLAETRKTVPINVLPSQFEEHGFVLVCPPSDALAERSGFTAKKWTDIITKRLQAITKRQIIIRQKPKVNHTPAPLLEALKGAWALVTYTSNAAIEATLAGYPAYCTGPNPCNVFGNTDVANIRRPHLADVRSREAWAAMLCANQWTLEEIAAGAAWKAIT